MSWADNAIKVLQEGELARVNPKGNSMVPKIKSGETVFVRPVRPEDIEPGDVVLAKVKGAVYLHYVKAIEGKDDSRRFQIGNASGHINGWTRTVYGRVDFSLPTKMGDTRICKAHKRKVTYCRPGDFYHNDDMSICANEVTEG